jgi:hypothetical protein
VCESNQAIALQQSIAAARNSAFSKFEIMEGQMQDWPMLVSSLLDYAERWWEQY